MPSTVVSLPSLPWVPRGSARSSVTGLLWDHVRVLRHEFGQRLLGHEEKRNRKSLRLGIHAALDEVGRLRGELLACGDWVGVCRRAHVPGLHGLEGIRRAVDTVDLGVLTV